MKIFRSTNLKIINGMVILILLLIVFWLFMMTNVLPILSSVAWNEPMM